MYTRNNDEIVERKKERKNGKLEKRNNERKKERNT